MRPRDRFRDHLHRWPLGFELATAIVKECRAAVELFDGLEKRRAANKPLIAKENAAKKAYRKSTGAPQ